MNSSSLIVHLIEIVHSKDTSQTWNKNTFVTLLKVGIHLKGVKEGQDGFEHMLILRLQEKHSIISRTLKRNLNNGKYACH